MVAALLQHLPSDLEAICMPFQKLDDMGALAIANAAVANKLPLRFLMLSRNEIRRACRNQVARCTALPCNTLQIGCTPADALSVERQIPQVPFRLSDEAVLQIRDLLPNLDDFHLRVNARGG